MKLLTLSKYIISLCILVVVVGCKPKAEVPVQFAEADIEVNIYPDYKDIVVHPTSLRSISLYATPLQLPMLYNSPVKARNFLLQQQMMLL
jgi:hypothetical protein